MSSVQPFPVPVHAVPAPLAHAGPTARQVEAAAVWLRPRLPWVHAFMFVVFLGLLLGPVLLPEGTGAHRLAGFSNWLICGLWFPLVFLSRKPGWHRGGSRSTSVGNLPTWAWVKKAVTDHQFPHRQSLATL